MIQLRPFTKNDWMGFAGAEKPSEKQEPMTGEADAASDWPEDLSGMDGGVVIIVDKNGVEVTGLEVSFANEGKFENGLELVKKIKEPVSVQNLKNLGFKQILGKEEKIESFLKGKPVREVLSSVKEDDDEDGGEEDKGDPSAARKFKPWMRK